MIISRSSTYTLCRRTFLTARLSHHTPDSKVGQKTMEAAAKYGCKMNHDPSWKGPASRKRSCTDTFWLVLFVACMIVWSGIAQYALRHGNIEKLTQPTDSEGRKCGIDSQVQDRPFLLFFDLTKCAAQISTLKYSYRQQQFVGCPTTQVCVARCPTKNFLFDAKHIGGSGGSLEQLKKDLICKIDVRVEGLSSVDDVALLVEREKCAKWYLSSTSLFRRCLPERVWGEFVNVTITSPQLEEARSVVESVARLEDVLRRVRQDIDQTKYVVLGISVASGLACLLYIVALRWMAEPCIWATILAVIAALGYATYDSAVRFWRNREETTWLIGLVAAAAGLSLSVLGALFLRERIVLATRLIKESSRAVTCILSSLLLPVLPWLLHLVVLTYGVTIFLYLLTIWEPNYRVEMMGGDGCYCPGASGYANNTPCVPDQFSRQCKDCTLSGCNLVGKTRPWFINHLHIVNVLASYWLFFFVSAFGEMVLAATFATWYWTLDKRRVPYFTITRALWQTARFHMGTLAFGALILTVCRIVRLALEWLHKKAAVRNAASANGAQVANGLLSCCNCFFYVLEKFLRFLNNNAYVMCAIHGKGFCRSARDAFNLLMRNVLRVVVMNKITSWLLMLGKLIITASTVAFTWWWYNYSQNNQGDPPANFLAVPVTMTAVASFLIATLFFKVHAAAIDTLLLCFLEDCERNDGSKDRPYYMSKRLKKLLHK